MAAKSKKQKIALLTKISGISDIHAEQAVEILGIETVDAFIAAGQSGELQKISGVGVKTEARMLASALAYQDKNTEKKSVAGSKKKNTKPPTKKEASGFDDLFTGLSTSPPISGSNAAETGDASPPKNPTKSDAKSISGNLDNRFWCPICHSQPLLRNSETLQCKSCKREFPILHGVVDLALSSTGGKTGWAQKVMETDFYSKRYEEFMRPKLTRILTSRTMEAEYVLSAQLLDLRESSGILDVACGTGNYTRYFAKVVESKVPIIGIDLSWPMLKKAKEYIAAEEIDNVSFVRADATQLPFGDESFDRVHCSGALYLIPDVDAALREFYRVSQPGALLVVGAFTQSTNVALRFIKNLSANLIQLRFFDEEELISRIEKVGFRVINESAEGDAITIKALRRYK